MSASQFHRRVSELTDNGMPVNEAIATIARQQAESERQS